MWKRTRVVHLYLQWTFLPSTVCHNVAFTDSSGSCHMTSSQKKTTSIPLSSQSRNNMENQSQEFLILLSLLTGAVQLHSGFYNNKTVNMWRRPLVECSLRPSQCHWGWTSVSLLRPQTLTVSHLIFPQKRKEADSDPEDSALCSCSLHPR